MQYKIIRLNGIASHLVSTLNVTINVVNSLFIFCLNFKCCNLKGLKLLLCDKKKGKSNSIGRDFNVKLSKDERRKRNPMRY